MTTTGVTYNFQNEGCFWRSDFTGKELDAETGYSYFGARYLDHTPLTLWLSVDPMADKYPSITPYAYCAWNPLKLVDPEGEEINPVYDLDGNFLGTDDLGLQGEPIIMDKSCFEQGMSHSDAIDSRATFTELLSFCNSEAFNKYFNHAISLSERPDWDGIVTREEGINWAIRHPGALQNPTPENTLYINTALLDFGNISVSDFENGVGNSSSIRTFNVGNLFRGLTKGNVQNTVYALGRVNLLLLDLSGNVMVVNDTATVYDWNTGGKIVRDKLVKRERRKYKLNDNHGFKTYYYGTGKVKE